MADYSNFKYGMENGHSILLLSKCVTMHGDVVNKTSKACILKTRHRKTVKTDTEYNNIRHIYIRLVN